MQSHATAASSEGEDEQQLRVRYFNKAGWLTRTAVVAGPLVHVDLDGAGGNRSFAVVTPEP